MLDNTFLFFKDFVFCGNVQVFVDIRAGTLNLDESLIKSLPIAAHLLHCSCVYTGLDCETDSVMIIGRQHGLKVVEDPAQRVCRPTKSGYWKVLVT